MSRAALILFTCLIAVFVLARFAALEDSPFGFYVDEAAESSQKLCLASEGTDGAGRKFPLYAVSDFGGVYYTPGLYLGAAWVNIFGNSIGSLRGLAAFAIAMAILGLSLIGKHFFGTAGAVAVALTASLSPWGFMLSRVAWEPPDAPAFLVWALYFFLCREGVRAQVLAGVLFFFAVESYSPLYIAGPFIIGVSVWLRYRGSGLSIAGFIRSYRSFALALAALAIPYLLLVFSTPQLRGRFQAVSILSQRFREDRQVQNSPVVLAKVFARNYAAHFRPSYLLVHGDRNPRHSSGASGQWSPLDAIALLILAPIAWVRRGFWKAKPVPGWKLSPWAVIAPLCVTGMLAGVIPSALTWEHIPHALRSLAAWPFTCLLSGSLLAPLLRDIRGAIAVFVVSIAFSTYFLSDYFGDYTRRAAHEFEPEVKTFAMQTGETRDWRLFLNRTPFYSRSAVHYYLMRYHELSCSESRERIQTLGKGP